MSKRSSDASAGCPAANPDGPGFLPGFGTAGDPLGSRLSGNFLIRMLISLTSYPIFNYWPEKRDVG